MNRIQTGSYTKLELFAKSERNEDGRIIVRREGSQESAVYPAGKHQYKLLRIPLEKESIWEVRAEKCTISTAYLSGGEDILENGVTYLEYADGGWLPISDLAGWYDTLNREQYHFNPFKNWINDPNGLCWFKGHYHMYYQANPHDQKWDHMYWGHAASKDLIHWVHLPYVLEPQEEILNSEDRKGGAFSGCAVAEQDKLFFYLTRHIGPMEDSEEETVQYQTMAVSEDGMELKEEKRILDKPDHTFSFNFRDPKVTWWNGTWNMVVGSRKHNVPVILRYTSDDLRSWEYQGVLLEERTEGVYTFECPDFFPVSEQKTAAVGAWMFYRDKEQRLQPTYYYIGEVHDGKLQVEYRGLYDFGSNFYAVQSFGHEGRRIAIGWVSDNYNEHVPEKNGAYGSMSLPREIFLRDGKLYRKPCEEIYRLREQCYLNIKRSSSKNIAEYVPVHQVRLEPIKGNSYYARLEFTGETGFTILLGRSERGTIRLVREGKRLQIKTEGVRSENVECVTEIECLKNVEIFVDRRVTEVFVNDGEEAGTKLFYQDKNDGIFTADFENEECVESIEVYGMKGIWR